MAPAQLTLNPRRLSMALELEVVDTVEVVPTCHN